VLVGTRRVFVAFQATEQLSACRVEQVVGVEVELFGGRGKAVHAVLGGIVIAAIDNGMGLQGHSAAAKYVVTAIVLLAAVTIDAVARRNVAR
jgi:ABC-type xylose transport system permease subunit